MNEQQDALQGALRSLAGAVEASGASVGILGSDGTITYVQPGELVVAQRAVGPEIHRIRHRDGKTIVYVLGSVRGKDVGGIAVLDGDPSESYGLRVGYLSDSGRVAGLFRGGERIAEANLAPVPDEQTLEGLLSLVSDMVPDMVPDLRNQYVDFSWDPTDRVEVANWAASHHLRASDHDDVEIPPMPAVFLE